MNLLDAQTLFRDYIDDPDQTFLTDSQVNQYLKFGINDWRGIIRQHRPDMLLETIALTVANTADGSKHHSCVAVVWSRAGHHKHLHGQQ